MTNIKNIALIGLLAVLCLFTAIPASAQMTTLTSTTLSTAQAATDRFACLTSATGVVVPSTSSSGSVLFIGDGFSKEMEQVTAVTSFSTSCFSVTRQQKPLAHVISVPVYIGARNNFFSQPPATGLGGTCTLTALPVHPYIDMSAGDIYTCVNSVWQKINGFGEGVTARATTQFDAVTGTTGVTLTNVVGMSVTVMPGTYRFYVNLPGVATGNSGIKAGFKYTGTALTSLEATGRAMTASALVVQHTTTATDQASLIASTTAAISTVIEGIMVVSTGGTVQLQAAQNAAHADTTSVYVGATMTFTRIN